MPKEEQTPTAELKNWTDLVKSEINSAVIWEKDWGELYKPKAPIGYEDRIAHLKAQLKTMPGTNHESAYQAQYKSKKPFAEIKVPTAGATSPEFNTSDPNEILGSSGTVNSKTPKY